MATKLTLTVDSRVIAAAEPYAADNGTSVSRLVEDFLAVIVAPPERTPNAPVLRRLRGVMREVDVEAYRKHLVDKYA